MPVVSASAAPPAATTASDTGYAALVRAERWADARQTLEALPEISRAQPEVRFVRARVALELDDAAAALTLLEGLHIAVPQLAPQIAEARARAQLRIGPFAEAARLLRTTRRHRVFAVPRRPPISKTWRCPKHAWHTTARSGASANPSARAAPKSVHARCARRSRRKSETEARRLPTIAGWPWLRRFAPRRIWHSRCWTATPQHVCRRSSNLDRATKLAEAGRIEATEAELALLAKAPGSPAPIGRSTYLRAFALYAARSNYPKAAELFERAAREDPDNAPRALFFAARGAVPRPAR